jgi:adenosine deaminase
MVSHDQASRWRTIPKVELHLHLDGSLALAKQRNAEGAMTKEALRAAAESLIDRLAEDGVVYAELRFAPLLHAERGFGAEEVVDVVTDAVMRYGEARGVVARVLLCTLRRFNETQSLETAELAYAFRDRGVVGLDLAGDEVGHPLAPHVPAFRFARAKGIARTAHAGEVADPETVRAVLRSLEPMRIGHGVHTIEDPGLVADLAGSRVHFEVCPSSNVAMGSFRSIAEHPIQRLFRAGVSVGINTDSRTVLSTTLTDEYAKLSEAFDWTAQTFTECNLRALDAAFVSDAEKARVRERIEMKPAIA